MRSQNILLTSHSTHLSSLFCMPLKHPEFPTQEEDLTKGETIQRILEEGTDGDLERLRVFAEQRTGTKIPWERMELIRAFAHQRRRHVKQAHKEAKERIANNPKATDEEYRLSVYREWIEPPSRDAVFALYRKGYPTYESGFGGAENQNMRFNPAVPELESYTPSEAVQSAFQEMGAKLLINQEAVSFTMTKLLSDEELKMLWDLLAEDIPTLSTQRKRHNVEKHSEFQQEQDARFGAR